MRVLVDYRPALRTPTGVGEYTRQLVSALEAGAAGRGLDLTIFSSSWKDRLEVPGELLGAEAIDLRVPVVALNLAWHRLRWPPIEWLTGRRFDVVHSFHPLLMPSRWAAQVITIYDLNFLTHPERTRAEIRRDYPALVRRHAQRADHIIVISEFTGREVQRLLGVPADRLSVCRPGAPDWPSRKAPPSDGYVLFLGTLEPRKNVGALLDAYERLLASRVPRLPRLVLAGHPTPDATAWLARIARPPLLGHVMLQGYVDPATRRSLYEGARLLVQPSHEEGFGMPVLEAMTLGVPVVAANRGALSEVLGDAGQLADLDCGPEDPHSLAGSMQRMLGDDDLLAAASARGVARAQGFRWADAASAARDAYDRALHRRRLRA